ncbi:(2Fe-2S)-binding protein (plasmid) [Deinococcus psychrotolerans]|uniref:(2Fe-2S)-binding protein n=1 Tax=Deinococcus psychrotolerans TaxID=2489213 RepID=A0A3G8YIT4_9DEIO|nr:(2Fe-2S)-binding protein [Deinococcus psychrotolerans]AZI44835.1 (2Fe-2S)-binding protein [Deinococcus psychrotolerans]
MPELTLAVLTLDGRRVTVAPGTTVLAALQNAGLSPLRSSLSGEPRGALCGMGSCYECRAVVDGLLMRTCLTPARDGQNVRRLLEVAREF